MRQWAQKGTNLQVARSGRALGWVWSAGGHGSTHALEHGHRRAADIGNERARLALSVRGARCSNVDRRGGRAQGRGWSVTSSRLTLGVNPPISLTCRHVRERELNAALARGRFHDDLHLEQVAQVPTLIRPHLEVIRHGDRTATLAF